jgi:hypothetical protein
MLEADDLAIFVAAEQVTASSLVRSGRYEDTAYGLFTAAKS